MLKAGVGVVGGLLALAGGWWLYRQAPSAREHDFGGLTCSEVDAIREDFLHGRLPPNQVAQVKQHVMLCPNCKQQFERLGKMEMLGQGLPICRRCTNNA